MDRRPWHVLTVWLWLSVLVVDPAAVRASLPEATLSQTVDATVFLVESAAGPQRDRRRQSLVLALRHLGDPALKPFFEHLAGQRSMELRIHGILGLAECDPDRRLDLTRIAELADADAQIQTIMASMDNDLLTNEDAEQLMGWEGIDPSVKEVVATKLIEAGRFDRPELLRPGLASENLGRRGLAAVLLAQLGEPGALEALSDLNGSDDRATDTVRRVLLSTIMRLELDRAAVWAMGLARDPKLSSRDSQLALHVAMRFAVAGSTELWQELYRSNTGKAARIRLALIALRVAPWTDRSVFNTLTGTEDELIRRIGATCRAVASGEGLTPAVEKLLETRSPVVNGWMAFYIRDQATGELAKSALKAWLDHWRRRGDGELTGELDDIVIATQLAFEQDVDWAVSTLRSTVSGEDAPKLLTQGVLMGLLRVQDDRAAAVIEGLPEFGVELADNLALVVKTRHGASLTDDEVDRVALLVRGGGGLPAALRVQAGWTLLKRLGKDGLVLERAIGD